MKRVLIGLLTFIFILSAGGCSCNKNKDDDKGEISQAVITAPLIKAYVTKDINGSVTYVDPFNTSISLSYFYKSDAEKAKDYFINEFTRLHYLFDRHYYYFDNNGNLINNLRVINESNGEPIKVDESLIEILKEGIRFTKLSKGKFNIGVGNLSDLWNQFISIGNVYAYGDLNAIYHFKYENGEYIRDDLGSYVNYYGVYVDISEMKRYSKNEDNYVEDADGNYVLLANVAPSQEQILQAQRCTPTYQIIEDVIVIDDENNTVTINKPTGCNGNFSITLGALAKSYAAEKISNNENIKNGNFLINAGGSTIKLVGENPIRDNGMWNIAITDSYQVYKTEKKYASLVMKIEKNKSISTSSGDENHYFYKDKYYHHIIDPISGYPNQNRFAVTSISNNAMYADIITTTIMSMTMDETKEYLELLKQEGIETELVIQDKENDFIKVYITNGTINNVSKNYDKEHPEMKSYVDSIVIEELNYDS